MDIDVNKKFLKNYKFWLIFGILVFTFILVYSPHFNSSFPLHVDEWTHLEYAEKLIQGGYDGFGTFEFGYHLFLAFFILFFSLLRINFVYAFFPAVFACFSSLILFFLVFKLTKNFWIGLFSMFFFAFLPSNANLLGNWFAIPFTFSIPLLLLFFYFSLDALKSNKALIICIGLLIALLISFPPSAIFAILVYSFYFVLFKRDSYRIKHLLIFLPFLLALIVFKIVWGRSFYKFFLFFYHNLTFFGDYFEPSVYINPNIYSFFGYSFSISQYFIPSLYGILGFFLALYGIYFCLKNNKLKLFLIWLLISVVFLFLFNLFGFSFFMRRQKLIYLCLIALIPFSSIGLYKLVFLIRKGIKKYSLFLLILIFIVLIYFSLVNYWSPNKGSELYPLIENVDYQALSAIRNLDFGVIIIDLNKAPVVYSIAKKEVVARFFPPLEDTPEKQDVRMFFSVDCLVKEEIINKYSVKYVFSLTPLDCGWTEIYKDKRYIYKIA